MNDTEREFVGTTYILAAAFELKHKVRDHGSLTFPSLLTNATLGRGQTHT